MSYYLDLYSKLKKACFPNGFYEADTTLLLIKNNHVGRYAVTSDKWKAWGRSISHLTNQVTIYPTGEWSVFVEFDHEITDKTFSYVIDRLKATLITGDPYGQIDYGFPVGSVFSSLLYKLGNENKWATTVALEGCGLLQHKKFDFNTTFTSAINQLVKKGLVYFEANEPEPTPALTTAGEQYLQDIRLTHMDIATCYSVLSKQALNIAADTAIDKIKAELRDQIDSPKFKENLIAGMEKGLMPQLGKLIIVGS